MLEGVKERFRRIERALLGARHGSVMGGWQEKRQGDQGEEAGLTDGSGQQVCAYALTWYHQPKEVA